MSTQPQITPDQYDADAPPEPEQHAQVIERDADGVAAYVDQSPALLDDEDVPA